MPSVLRSLGAPLSMSTPVLTCVRGAHGICRWVGGGARMALCNAPAWWCVLTGLLRTPQLPSRTQPCLTRNTPHCSHLACAVRRVQPREHLAGLQAAVLRDRARHDLQRLGKARDRILVQPGLLLAKVGDLCDACMRQWKCVCVCVCVRVCVCVCIIRARRCTSVRASACARA
jgi:hypothetical protein